MKDEVKNEETDVAQPDQVERYVTYTPAVDVYENDAGYLLEAYMPGTDGSSVDVTVEDRVLYLRAKPANGRHDGYTLVREEHGPSAYYRAFTLSDHIDVAGIKAKVREGLLRVVLPKAEESKPRKIEIQSE